MGRMIFELIPKEDKFLEKIYRDSMKELEDFFKINWKRNTPRIILIKNRINFENLKGEKTEDWFVGEADGRNIFLLNRKNYEKESCHKYSDESYTKLIKHELGHLFFNALSGGNIFPLWLNEGLCIYLSCQLKSFKKKPKKFSKFLNFYKEYSKDMYYESGFIIELLIKKFGKRKLLSLVKSLRRIDSEREFKKIFKKIYGFELNYKEINRLWEE